MVKLSISFRLDAALFIDKYVDIISTKVLIKLEFVSNHIFLVTIHKHFFIFSLEE